ncbi:unnamed protein product [Rotaria magnacalcarata]|uniref:Uncharacterized protein n=2 Tax=Rotaria magnacalcarata TaxID=392030 RepID=A0A816R1Q2_9BILA|nr:unnamed protein product [Rotaria magnacalcarata]CAF3871587.1 unnamed protein product [Rotaria magnacalcarata]
MQQFLLAFILLIIDGCQVITIENPLYQSINISLVNNTDNEIHFTTPDDFDNEEIRVSLNYFIKWFTPVLVVFSLLIALVCPFLLWILQERCLYRTSISSNHQSIILIASPRLLLIDPRTKLHSPSFDNTPFNSPEEKKSYSSSRTSSIYTTI